MLEFARSYKLYGLHEVEEGILYKEWAPSATAVSLFGDFNGWDRDSHKCEKKDFGMWELLLKRKEDGSLPIKHGSKIKLSITRQNGERVERNPPWIHYLD